MNITKVAELEKTESFECEWKGHKIRFEALATSLTPNFLKDTRDQALYARAVAENVRSWDVTKDDEGTPWPLTEPELARLPTAFLDTVLAAIAESWTGDKKKPEASQNGSAAAAS
jgi:hypothetical protein